MARRDGKRCGEERGREGVARRDEEKGWRRKKRCGEESGRGGVVRKEKG